MNTRLPSSARNRELDETPAKAHLRLLALFDQAPGFISITRGPQHVMELANQAYFQMIGDREVIGKPIREAFPEIEGQGYFELLDEVYSTGKPFLGRAMPASVRRGPEQKLEQLFVDFVFQPIIEEDGSIWGIMCQGHDVTAQKMAQDALLQQQAQLENLVAERTAALKKTEAALLQAQKMEAIGKLTGGIAHDFNNILQVIGGNLGLLKLDFAGNTQATKRLQEAIAAVDRGAGLSSQLLSFARRQPLQPVATNLGRILRDMDDLLRRALGESIEIETIVSGGLWNALVDRTQLENVILNLAINARDAMKGTGRLTLELGNAMLDDYYAQAHAEVTPGQYVMLAISDTGSGMSPEIMERAFEPFFTTKPEGEGTGLGLSMVYGFVKQSGGHIKIYSELGNGTTFKIYLPRVHQEETALPDIRKKPVVGGSETVLVVEDDVAVQATAIEMLTSLGYKVLKAKDGQSALNILQSGVSVDLLFTDVVMPGPVRSPDLARHAKELLPQIAVLFTSGYTQNAIVHGGRLDPGIELITKPYRQEDLARKIRHVLANNEQASRAQQMAKAVENIPCPVNAAGNRSILVVEDNRDSQQMLCELLIALGHHAQGVPNAEEALAMLKDHDFEVLLTDLSLPGMSGMELARKALTTHPDLKIVFSSGYGTIECKEFQAYTLPKPYDLAQLQELLSKLN